jgi:hypothetical protein
MEADESAAKTTKDEIVNLMMDERSCIDLNITVRHIIQKRWWR